jgi:glutaredoxin 3
MPTIDIYMRPTCPFCQKAMALLKAKGAAFNALNIEADPSLRPTMIERANGRTTVPQIFINGEHIGGCDDLHALDARGKLDAKLAA